MLQPYNIDQLQNLNSHSAQYQDASAIANMRDQALKQIAQTLGVQAGLAHESKRINKRLNEHAQRLDAVFNFNGLLYNHYLLPPVIEQTSNSLKVSDDGLVIRAGGHSYKIINQVQFVTTPPTWQDYLLMSYQPPLLPPHSVLPKNVSEQKIWAHAIVDGWSKGIDQALSVFKVNIHKLSRDFNGMVLYKRLLAKNMISPFYVKKKNLGVTGNSQNITVDDTTMQITVKPQLQKTGSLWESISVKKDNKDK